MDRLTYALDFSDVNTLYVALLSKLLDEGKQSAPRNLPIKELLGVQLRLNNPIYPVITIPSRALNYHFMAAEALWILMGRDDVEMLSAYNSRVSQFSDDGVTFWGAYGPRLVSQRARIVSGLRDDRDSRQAVIQVWKDPAGKTKDVPCTLSWQFLIREGKLVLLATMRSSDAWLGIPYDLHSFSAVQRSIAASLEVPCGDLILTLGSSHLYETDWEKATRLVEAYRARLKDPVRVAALPVVGQVSASVWKAEEAARKGAYGLLTTLDAVTPPWQAYSELLAHRFLKDDERLKAKGDHPFCQFVATKEW